MRNSAALGDRDVLMLVCDGLSALPDAVNVVWPQTVVQTCIVHLIRNSLRYASAATGPMSPATSSPSTRPSTRTKPAGI
ncbi:transposase [Streptomyces sp. NPDC048106]|uniref:transposase n=1 Tax=Streptomyces sp. NPDC048106 TaxID=3155750 RepID=UPI00345604C4